jgi:hypothetical protein
MEKWVVVSGLRIARREQDEFLQARCVVETSRVRGIASRDWKLSGCYTLVGVEFA